jgi:hypothetical protein
MTTARNVAIILALAAAVAFLPGAGSGASLLVWVLGICFLAALAWFAARAYREYRGELFGLGDRMRLVLYGSIGVVVLTLTATDRLWDTGPGTVAWVLLLAAAAYGVFSVWRFSRQY